MNKFLAILVLSSFSTLALADEVTCKDLEKAYKADKMNVGPYKCKDRDTECKRLQEKQLRETVKFYRDDLSKSEIDKMTRKELESEFQPLYERIYVGDHAYDSVSIDMGDNPFDLHFTRGTTDQSGVAIVDGTIEVNGKYCEDIEFSPYLSMNRLKSVCSSVLPLVKKAIPTTKYDWSACTDKDNIREMYIETYNSNKIEMNFGENLQKYGGWYYGCKITMNRKTDKVTSVACKVHTSNSDN